MPKSGDHVRPAPPRPARTKGGGRHASLRSTPDGAHPQLTKGALSDTHSWDTIGRLADLFTSLDTARGMPPEQQWTLQALKLSEEASETAQAVIGAWGSNPRKGQSHTWRHVQGEMVDTAITSTIGLYRMLGEEAPAFFDAVLAQKAAKFLPEGGVESAPAAEGA
ncbi:MazG-like family protein [Streptomyces sp. SD31]|uniref:MazG-like family protein n=1 Tax=Streptomyces sp. SD31 TaxID=3452208 RepID=UPI003F89B1D7